MNRKNKTINVFVGGVDERWGPTVCVIDPRLYVSLLTPNHLHLDHLCFVRKTMHGIPTELDLTSKPGMSRKSQTPTTPSESTPWIVNINKYRKWWKRRTNCYLKKLIQKFFCQYICKYTQNKTKMMWIPDINYISIEKQTEKVV